MREQNGSGLEMATKLETLSCALHHWAQGLCQREEGETQQLIGEAKRKYCSQRTADIMAERESDGEKI